MTFEDTILARRCREGAIHPISLHFCFAPTGSYLHEGQLPETFVASVGFQHERRRDGAPRQGKTNPPLSARKYPCHRGLRARGSTISPQADKQGSESEFDMSAVTVFISYSHDTPVKTSGLAEPASTRK